MNPNLQTLLNSLKRSAQPFALYRKPNESTLHIVIQDNTNICFLEDVETDKGFVFAPFASHILPPMLLKASVTSSIELSFDRDQSIKATQIEEKPEDEQHYKNLVTKAVEQIKSGEFEKVVTSRRISLPLDHEKHSQALSNMLMMYPWAMVYYFHHPKIGTWTGASPELLLELKNDKLHTMSLAGTLPPSGHWSEKERAEQNIVSVHIADTLDENHCLDIEISHPYDRVAGSVTHLCSDITARLSPETEPLKLLKDLAPTPALCGHPKDKALSFIAKNEDYKRTFYGGYMGECNLSPEQKLDLYVNIRCAELLVGSAFVYVGGGITELSDPTQEWDETQRKASIMASAILSYDQ